MSSINIDDAKAHLAEIISGLNPGDQTVIVQDGRPLATLTRNRSESWPCKAGKQSTQHWMAPDFDAPLDDFREYMQ